MARPTPSLLGSDRSLRPGNKTALATSSKGVTKSTKRAQRIAKAGPLRRSARVQDREVRSAPMRPAIIAASQTIENATSHRNSHSADAHEENSSTDAGSISENHEDETASINENRSGVAAVASGDNDQFFIEDPRRVIASQPGLDLLYRQGLIRNIHFSTSLVGMIDIDELNEELTTFHGSYQNALTVNDEIMYNATVGLMRIQLTLYLQFARHWNTMPQFTKAGEASHVKRKLDGSCIMLLPESMMPGVLSE